MIDLVLGTPGSGKSDIAEQLIENNSFGKSKIYLATMTVQDEESIKRIIKHRKKREGKSFITVECSKDLHVLKSVLEENYPSVCLLECVSNLVANEIFEDKNLNWTYGDMIEKIKNEIMFVSSCTDYLVAVSNDFSQYYDQSDNETKRYIELMSEINNLLIKTCDGFYFVKDGKIIDYENI